MKIVKVLLVAILLSLTASANAFSYPHHNRPAYPHPHPIIGAPLDGGILAVLGAAGLAYYATRKNKKNKPGA